MNPIGLPNSRLVASGGILLALIATHVAAELPGIGTAFAQSPRTAAETRAPLASTRAVNPVDSGGFTRPSGVTPAISNNVTPAFQDSVTPAFRGSVAPAFASNPTPPVGAATESSRMGAAPSSRISGVAPDSVDASSSGSVDAGGSNTTIGGGRAVRTQNGRSASAPSQPVAIDPANTDTEGNDRDIGGIDAARGDDPDFVIVGPTATTRNSSSPPQFAMICRNNLRSGCNPPPTFVIER
jgi:hypothetical protein